MERNDSGHTDYDFHLLATTSYKNVETLQRKTGLFFFKSPLVTIMCNIILTSLLPPHFKLFLQVLSMHGLLLLATLIREGGGITSTRSWKGHLSQKLIRYSVSSTFATGCSLEKGKRRLFFWPNSSPFFFYSSSPNSFSKNSETR